MPMKGDLLFMFVRSSVFLLLKHHDTYVYHRESNEKNVRQIVAVAVLVIIVGREGEGVSTSSMLCAWSERRSEGEGVSSYKCQQIIYCTESADTADDE
jgi:hypothetical protein